MIRKRKRKRKLGKIRSLCGGLISRFGILDNRMDDGFLWRGANATIMPRSPN